LFHPAKIKVDPSRDHGDPEPENDGSYDRDLFMKGPRDDPSDRLLAALRAVQPAVVAESRCPAVEAKDPEWWRHPYSVVLRRMFELPDGSLKVPVLAHDLPHGGCWQFAFYRAVPTTEGWRIESPRSLRALCY